MTTGNFDSAVEQLATGFETLSEEYRQLAKKYKDVEQKLNTATEEFQALRALIPERLRGRSFIIPTDPSTLAALSKKTLIELLEEQYAGKSDIVAVERIREAEKACFRVKQPREKRGRVIRMPTSTDGRSSRRLVDLTPDMEDAGKNDCLSHDAPRCPFAIAGGPMPADHPSVPDKSKPSSSRNSLSVSRSDARSKRPSFHDPLKPEVKLPSIRSSSTSVGSGPACPIRFLGEHSPEDIAKYFEDHKSELPRSHEICIRRFQDNSSGIRALDEKYGSLVSMIQGLGQYHKPMLPEVPKIDYEEEEDRESNSKIKAWAENVDIEETSAKSDVALPPLAAIPGKIEEEDETAPDEDENRESRFERPLKEIRVGESPSRPWGVPIPAKYIRRASGLDSEGSGESRRESHAAPHDETTGFRRNSSDVEPIKSAAVNGEGGKCPFDHTKLGGMKDKPSTMKPGLFNHPPDALVKDQPKALQAVEPVRASPARVDDQTLVDAVTDGSQIINHGVAIIANPAFIHGKSLVNHGALIMGYTAETAQAMYQNVMNQQKA